MSSNAEMAARAAVKAVRYPPQGERGMAAGSRAAEFGRIPLVEHMAQSNREILLACMIEDMEAVERIDEIAAVEGRRPAWRSAHPICRARSGSAASPTIRGWWRRSTGSAKRRKRAPAPARTAAEPRRLPAQCRAAQGARRRLYQLRADPRSAPAAIDARAGRRGAQAPRLNRAAPASAAAASRRCRRKGSPRRRFQPEGTVLFPPQACSIMRRRTDACHPRCRSVVFPEAGGNTRTWGNATPRTRSGLDPRNIHATHQGLRPGAATTGRTHDRRRPSVQNR